MCGIFGGIVRDSSKLFSEERLASAHDTIDHRGPDSSAIAIYKNAFFCHKRLTIIDLSQEANQPFEKHNKIFIYNGEIYNYKALQEGLNNIRFKTHSDTEVLFEMLHTYHEKALPKLEGMFAFALYEKNNDFLLARDKYGEKPLYFYLDNDYFIFASEITPIKILLKERLEIDPDALSLYFQFSFIPAPRSPYKNLFQLEPGQYLNFNPNKWELRKNCYYKLNEQLTKPSRISYKQAQEELKSHLTTAVVDRIDASDVPVSTFLSGGIDSSVVTLLGDKFSKKLTSAYSVIYPENKDFDESIYADEVAKHLKNTNHVKIPITENIIFNYIDVVLNKLSEPYADSSLIPSTYLCNHVNEKVILGGDGADELFGGYGSYSSMLLAIKFAFLIKLINKFLPAHQNPAEIKSPIMRKLFLFKYNYHPNAIQHYLNWRTYISAEILQKIGLPENNELFSLLGQQNITSLSALQSLDMHFNLPNDMLKKVDYASMFSSIELRSPFLDSNLVHFALNLPDEYKIKRDSRKRVLRDAFRDILPKSIYHRPKQGFLLPLRTWFRSGNLSDALHEMIQSQTKLNTEPLNAIMQDHKSGKNDYTVFLWQLYVFFKWLKG